MLPHAADAAKKDPTVTWPSCPRKLPFRSILRIPAHSYRHGWTCTVISSRMIWFTLVLVNSPPVLRRFFLVFLGRSQGNQIEIDQKSTGNRPEIPVGDNFWFHPRWDHSWFPQGAGQNKHPRWGATFGVLMVPDATATAGTTFGSLGCLPDETTTP